MTTFISTHLETKVWRRLFLLFFLVLYLAESLELSMFVDGLWYAVISRNLAEGYGSFWVPQFSATIFSSFHEHPPLMFGVQSLFFQVFGAHWLTERVFSFFQYALSVGLLIYLWRAVFPKAQSLYRAYWLLPLLFWQGNMLSYYFQPANLLDTGVAIWAMATIGALLYALKHSRPWLAILLAAFFLLLGFLTKGLVSLFPLAFPFLHWLVFRQHTFRRILGYTLLLLGALLGMLFLLCWFNPEARFSLQQYFEVQVLASLSGTRRLYYYRSSRWYILGQLALTLLPMLLTYVTLRLITWRQRSQLVDRPASAWAILFLLVGLSASLPIMISPRQALPYLIPALPYFSLAIAIWTIPHLNCLMSLLVQKAMGLLKFTEHTLLLGLLMAVILVGHKYGQTNSRDQAVIQDAQLIGHEVGEVQTIGSTTYNMYISGYLMRFQRISLDTLDRQSNWLLTPKTKPLPTDDLYQIVPLPTKSYNLYKRQSALSRNDQ